MNLKHISVAALVALTSVASNAAVGSLGGDTNSVDFTALTTFNVSGGSLLTSGITDIAAEPAATFGAYLAVGPNNANNGGGDATFTIAGGASQVSFDWGTPDSYNTLYVKESNGSVASFTTSSLSLGSEGNVTFKADAGTSITSLRFDSSNQNAFEAANFAVTPVPEPASAALMLAGLGMFGFMARRQRRS